MKTKLLFLFFSVLFSLNSFSQEWIHSFSNQKGEWSNYYRTWVWDDISNSKISFLIQGNVIIANDKASSTYTTLDVLFEEDSSIGWTAIDEKGITCAVSLSVVNGYNCLIIVYSEICFRYYY